MSAASVTVDFGLDTALRPVWLRPVALSIAVAVHALLLAAVLWPRDIEPPVETKIEVSIVPQQIEAEWASAANAPSAPQIPPNEAAQPDMSALIDPVAPSDIGKPAEIKSADAALSPETAPLPPQIMLPAPPPPVASREPPAIERQPTAPEPVVAQPAPVQPALPVAQSDQPAMPIQPTPPTPAAAEAKDEQARKLAAERRRLLLLREKELAEREAGRREAADKARQAAENAKRQAEARGRAAQRAAATSRPASLPPAAGPVATGKPAPSAVSPAALGAFRGQVIGHLAGYKRYPESARARGAEGRPSVSFVLDASGHVISVTLSHSSGQPDIDAEVVAMVRRASPFPAPPPGANRSFSATIGFTLH